MNMLMPPRGFAFYPNEETVGDLRVSADVTTKEIDVRAVHTKTELLSAIARALDFPPIYLDAINYDAFDEAIRDLSWLRFNDLAIVLIGCSHLWVESYAMMTVMLEMLTDAHLVWAEKGKGFFVAFIE